MENNEYKEGETVTLTQTRSATGRDPRFCDTLTSLGLGKIGNVRKHKIDKAVWGKIERVLTVIKISRAK
jgi:ribosomal protein L30